MQDILFCLSVCLYVVAVYNKFAPVEIQIWRIYQKAASSTVF
jgi:hypothetical protein